MTDFHRANPGPKRLITIHQEDWQDFAPPPIPMITKNRRIQSLVVPVACFGVTLEVPPLAKGLGGFAIQFFLSY